MTATYTPGHEVGKSPVVLFVEEQVADAPAEGLLVVSVVDDLQHRLRVTGPRPVRAGRPEPQSAA